MLSRTIQASIAFLSAISMGYAHDYKNDQSSMYDSSTPMSSRQQMGQMQERVITPDAGPKVADGVDVIITADFIWWRAREDGLSFAQTGQLLDPQTPGSNSGRGSVQHPNFDWEPGFKVGLGMTMNHDGWDVYAQYTWLRSTPSTNTIRRENTNTENAISPALLFLPGTSGDPYTLASGRWKFYYNVIDAELGRNFYVSKYLTTRPFVGFKGTWQDDDWRVRYQQTEVGSSLTQEVRERNDIDYWGFGIRGGMNTGWYFMRNFCLFADWALSAMWGKYDNDIKDKLTPDIADRSTFFTTKNTSADMYSITGVLEWMIGLRYDIWWSDDDYHFGIQAGWEEQLWFNHNHHYKNVQDGSHGGLNMQGLDLKVRFDF